MRNPRGHSSAQIEASFSQNPPRGLSASRILLYIFAIIVVGLILLNFLPTIGVSGCVGVVEVTGEIATASAYGVQSSGEIASLLKKAEDRPDIRAVLVLIDSPGGSVVASREIYTAVKDIKKPTVAYISDVGASGGYFAALGADKIYADRASLTGSIGARATVIELSKLLSTNGINATVIKSGAMKDIGDMFRPMTEEEKKLLQESVDEIAADFRNIAHESRIGKNDRYTAASLDKVADARILTGLQAYNLGLVDELGTKKDAINAAAASAGMDSDPPLCVISPQKDFLSSMFSTLGNGIGEAVSRSISSQQIRIS